MKNRNLIIIFVLLLGIFLGAKFLKKKKVRSFETDIVKIDTSGVDKIIFFPNNGSPAFDLVRNNGEWNVTSDGSSYETNPNNIQSLLTSVIGIKAKRVIAKSKEKWSTYEVDDQSAKRVQFYQNGKLASDLYIGKFDLNQQTRQAKSFVRVDDDQNVYSVDGYATIGMSHDVNSYRNNQITQFNPANVKSISIYDHGKSTSYQKENYWLDEQNIVVDSSAMANYLKTLSTTQSTNFFDAYNESDFDITQSVQIILSNGKEITINCSTAKNGITIDKPFIIHSTQNNESYFLSDSTGIYERLFKLEL